MSIFFTKVRESCRSYLYASFKLDRKSYQRRSTLLRRKRRNFPIFDEIPRVWRFFKMATMSVFLEEP